ncbi:MAG: glycosyltransferase family 4 protein [Caldilineaceae bacterium]|nr:glycosyltransferase family 4 protein [Caldilineaceae bacterium]
MHIALNAQLISAQESYRSAGVSNYSRQLCRSLGELNAAGATAHEFVVLAHVDNLAAPGLAVAPAPHLLERPLARIVWEQTALPLLLARGGFDLVHGLVNMLPLASPVAGVITVHDLSFVRAPGRLPPLKQFYQTVLARQSVARARAVIAVSEQTAADVIACFGAPPARVHVVHNGVGAEFTPGDPVVTARFRAAHGLPARFLLSVGTLEPRKNLERLVRCFARWRAQAAPEDMDIHLVLAGGKGWGYDAIFAAVQAAGLENVVHFPGFVPWAELADWYRAALALIYPSLFEGFGLPVLEAMACGAPVLCSQAPGVQEVAGAAALTVPPQDEDALVDSLRLLVGQPALRAELRRRGLAHAARFSWQRCAEETVAVYDRVLSMTHDV